MNLRVFYEGIENNAAFSFVADENGKFVPMKLTRYALFSGETPYFIAFENELRDINEYCCEVSKAILKKYDAALNKAKQYQNLTEQEFIMTVQPFMN